MYDNRRIFIKMNRIGKRIPIVILMALTFILGFQYALNSKRTEGNTVEKDCDVMFVFKRFETNPRRNITPPPDSILYYVGVRSVADIRDRLIELGTEEIKFPDAMTIERRGWTDNTLTENEYTQAVKDMIHGTLIGEQQYGNYEIYFAQYDMSDDAGIKF